MSIDWDATRKAWNRDCKTNFVTRKDFLFALYNESNKSAVRAGRKIYVSNQSFLKAMREDKLKISPKGHRFPTPTQKIVLSLDTKNMTLKEIRKTTGLPGQYCWALLKKLKLPWKKVRGQKGGLI